MFRSRFRAVSFFVEKNKQKLIRFRQRGSIKILNIMKEENKLCIYTEKKYILTIWDDHLWIQCKTVFTNANKRKVSRIVQKCLGSFLATVITEKYMYWPPIFFSYFICKCVELNIWEVWKKLFYSFKNVWDQPYTLRGSKNRQIIPVGKIRPKDETWMP